MSDLESDVGSKRNLYRKVYIVFGAYNVDDDPWIVAVYAKHKKALELAAAFRNKLEPGDYRNYYVKDYGVLP